MGQRASGAIKRVPVAMIPAGRKGGGEEGRKGEGNEEGLKEVKEEVKGRRKEVKQVCPRDLVTSLL